MDAGIAQLRRYFERRRRRIAIRDRERRAVRKDTSRPPNRQLTDREHVAVEFELVEAPAVGAQRTGSALDIGLEIPLLLLEVLRAKEQALGPDDLATIRHESLFFF